MVIALTDTADILARLADDRVHAAYAIADLEPHLRAGARFYTTDTASDVVVLVYRSPAFNALWLCGDPTVAASVLRVAPPSPNAPPSPDAPPIDLPERFHFIIREPYVALLRAHHDLTPQPLAMMTRMVVDEARFVGQPTPRGATLDSQRLSIGDATPDELDAFYAGRTPAWSPSMAQSGVYVAARLDGRIVAAAGTHVLAESFGIAAVGNVFTEPSVRGQGLATRTTCALVERLLPRAPTIVLNVEVANGAAVRVYERLGFEHHESLAEGMATRHAGPAPG